MFYGDRKEYGHQHTICTWQSLNILLKIPDRENDDKRFGKMKDEKRIKYINAKTSYIIRKTPMEIANNRFSQLNKKGFAKEFYTEISHITREYIEYSTYIRTLEMTTEEIIQNRDLFLIDDDSFSKWITILSKADLVKYAKQAIEPSEMDIDKNKAINFINNLELCLIVNEMNA